MSDKKLKNIKQDDIAIDQNGELELSEELQDMVAGGVMDADAADTNYGCGTNISCGKESLR